MNRKPPFKPRSQTVQRDIFDSKHSVPSHTAAHDMYQQSCVVSEEPMFSYEVRYPSHPTLTTTQTQTQQQQFVPQSHITYNNNATIPTTEEPTTTNPQVSTLNPNASVFTPALNPNAAAWVPNQTMPQFQFQFQSPVQPVYQRIPSYGSLPYQQGFVGQLPQFGMEYQSEIADSYTYEMEPTKEPHGGIDYDISSLTSATAPLKEMIDETAESSPEPRQKRDENSQVMLKSSDHTSHEKMEAGVQLEVIEDAKEDRHGSTDHELSSRASATAPLKEMKEETPRPESRHDTRQKQDENHQMFRESFDHTSHDKMEAPVQLEMIEDVKEEDSQSEASNDTVQDDYGVRRDSVSGLAVEHGQKNPLTYDVSQLLGFQAQYDEKPDISPRGQHNFPQIEHAASDMKYYISLVVYLSDHEFNKSIRSILNKICTENFARCMHDLKYILHSTKNPEYWVHVMKQCLDSAPDGHMYGFEYAMIIKQLFDTFQETQQENSDEKEEGHMDLKREVLGHLQHLFDSQKNLVIEMHPYAGDDPDTYKREKDRLLGIVDFIGALYQNGFLKSKNLLFYGLLYRLMRPPHGHDVDMDCVLRLIQQCADIFDFTKVKQDLKEAVSNNSFRIKFLVGRFVP